MARPERILLAEDDFSQRDILLEILSAEGYEVSAAGSPSAVLEKLRTFQPDLVLLDYVGIATPQVIVELFHRGRRPGVILVSGDSRVRKIARELQADAFLEKPYELPELLGTAEAVLGRRRAESPMAYGSVCL